MNKRTLIEKIAKDTGATKRLAGQCVNAFIDAVTRTLRKGETLTIVGFGTFRTTRRKARMARNPQTGAAMRIPKRKAVRFVAGKALKGAIG